jgi:hypothetical protein
VIDDFYAEYGSLSGEQETITALAKTVAEMTFGADAALHQQILDHLMREISQYEAEFAQPRAKDRDPPTFARARQAENRDQGSSWSRLSSRSFPASVVESVQAAPHRLGADAKLLGNAAHADATGHVGVPNSLPASHFPPPSRARVKPRTEIRRSGIGGGVGRLSARGSVQLAPKEPPDRHGGHPELLADGA